MSPDRNHLRSGERKTLSVHPAAYRYPIIFRTGEDLEGKGDGHHRLHAVQIETSGILTFTAPTANRLWGLPLPLLYFM